MGWRPDGWRKFWDSKDGMMADEEDIYEAGADAILEALFKLASESPTGTFTFNSLEVTVYGVEND